MSKCKYDHTHNIDLDNLPHHLPQVFRRISPLFMHNTRGYLVSAPSQHRGSKWRPRFTTTVTGEWKAFPRNVFTGEVGLKTLFPGKLFFRESKSANLLETQNKTWTWIPPSSCFFCLFTRYFKTFFILIPYRSLSQPALGYGQGSVTARKLRGTWREDKDEDNNEGQVNENHELVPSHRLQGNQNFFKDRETRGKCPYWPAASMIFGEVIVSPMWNCGSRVIWVIVSRCETCYENELE